MESLTIAEGLGIIFDLDGVILHSNPVHEVAWQQYFERIGVAPPPNFAEQMYGKRNDQILTEIFPGLDAEGISRHSKDKEALFRELMAPEFEGRLTPGLREFLEANGSRPIGLGTNAEKANADFALETAGIRQHFRVEINGWMVPNAKPAPDIYLRVAEELGLHPRNCIIFEDSFSGVKAGLAAGARVVGITSTHEHFPMLDLSVRHFAEPALAAWISRQRPL
ncbi:MAG: HAD family phosphatase [Bryobacterales bacterium]|nr:HAD family phosphatase [Bryobacterales bacterium]